MNFYIIGLILHVIIVIFIAKTLKIKNPCEGYSNPKDVPKFYLENEDDVWSLERVIHYCQDYKLMVESKGSPFSVRDICVGHKNCKHGVHDLKDLVCVDDLIKGTCSCGPNIYDETRDRILGEIEVLKKKLLVVLMMMVLNLLFQKQ